MNEDQLEAYLASCTQALAAKQAAIVAEHADFAALSWQLDSAVQQIRFSDVSGERLRFGVTAIGTFAAAQETWKWSWANSKLPQAARDSAECLKNLQGVTDYDCFSDAEAFAVDDAMAWELAAAAVAYLQADGCFRARNRDTWLFLALHRY
ncbi:MAG: DUF6882 domain-containing protein [Paraperlucidibaca sp.]